MSISDRMTTAAKQRAMRHVLDVCTQGSDIEVIKASSKDELGTITAVSSLDLKAFPIRFSPFDRETLQKITWAENCDILCYVSKLAVDNLSVTLKQLKKRYVKLKYDDIVYDIRYIEYYDAFADDWLYIIFGGTK